jgi:nucleotide-binding universal stress UspA family protein
MSPLDCSPRGDWALRLAARFARSQQSELWMVHVVPVPEMARRAPATPEEATLAQQVISADRKAADAHLRSAAARLSSPDLTVRTQVALSPHVAETLEEFVRREAVDLVVLCAHGLSARTSQPYGSVATSLLSFCHSPLLVLQDLPRRAITAARVSGVGDRAGQLSSKS